MGWQGIRPTVRSIWSSEIPSEGNDGELWAGRGTSASVSGGLRYHGTYRGRRIQLILSPTLAYSQNETFQITPGRTAGRSSFSSPFHDERASADLPLRFGDLPIRTFGPGQSSVTVTDRRLEYGVSTANEWWGPAIRNTLLLSNNAPGVPRLFVRTAAPVRTRFGEFAGGAFIGALTESPYFDRDPSNDTRALSGLLVTYRTSLDTGLTLGLSRLVMAPVRSAPGVLLHSLDAVVRYERVQTLEEIEAEGGTHSGSDQMFSLFARWVFPESGFESYVEWARTQLPRSLSEYLSVPQNTQGYTLGVQWADPRPGTGFLRVQGEVTYLEQTQVIGAPTMDFYTGRAAVQGFTQRGQVLGAPIGPGGSSQFVGADWLTGAWQIGAFASRTRNESDAMYRQPVNPRDTQHDVTLQSGVRAGLRLTAADLFGAVSASRRYNYLFQSDYYLFGPVQAIDVRNVSVTFVLSPR
jgi:hypothetical protein